LPLFTAGIHKIIKKTGAYLFYMHPWEIDPDQPVIKNTSRVSAWRHYLNLDKTHLRLSKMLKHFRKCRYQTCSNYLSKIKQSIITEQALRFYGPRSHAPTWECMPNKEN
jgi:hypothetical protein